MNVTTMLRRFCDAVERRDGKAFAALFTEDGVYHDVFYGAFKGRAKIAEMIDDLFYRTATEEYLTTRPAFRWRQLIALARVTASEHGYAAPGYADACRLLSV